MFHLSYDFRWAFLFLILVAVITTRYFSHPAALDFIVHGPSQWSNTAGYHQPHVLHRDVRWTTAATSIVSTVTRTASSTGGLATGSGTTTLPPTATSALPVSAQAVPTVPPSPPVIPSPFPQPFSAGIPTDGMTVSCVNFFSNMTNSLSFWACRPFSLLMQSSDDFVNAQTNLTLLNELVWGTCNPTPGEGQCIDNLGWFADQLQLSCPRELQSDTPIAADTLTALQAYGLMYNTACIVDPSTNAYCYIEAAHNSNPADLYLYQLPIDIAFPNSATPTCSSCSKDILNMYLAALNNSTQAAGLHALASTYNSGARAADTQCGSTFATVSSSDAVPSWSLSWIHALPFISLVPIRLLLL
ncbi:hypothetical protein F5887DRAFT_1129780 [Amanita rubescens]|nr:hypothetical protein F5887DRAFT_1129780 [Amanita rubescens]